ncbi:kinase-like domain-containing protein [Rhizophagus irregularis DAOM 181602=DAOM 197198]|nr:kinase-like domain-containing protein [Rhizophagus irregularis DAOM 181602=DAOM 197198]
MENLEENPRNWTSGSEEIDDFIREIQLKRLIRNPNVFKWVPYNQFSNIKKIGNGDFAVATLKHKQNDVTVNLKYFYNSQNITTNELRDEISIIFDIYGISQNPDTKDFIFVLQDEYCEGCGENDIKEIRYTIYSALWNDGKLKYDLNKKEWTRVQVEINLKLCDSQNTIDEFLNKVVEYKDDYRVDIYGISQNPDTKDYIFVLQDVYCEGCALWNDGQLKYGRYKKEWTRIQVEINLKLCNSQSTIDEFLNKVVEYKNDDKFKIYGISQNPDTKDYVLVSQGGYCEECDEKYTEIQNKWLWNDDQLKYDQNKKEWTRVQAKEVILKLCNSHNTIDEFLNKAKAYYKISQIYGISQESITKDYIMVLQKKYYESPKDIIFEWIPYNQFNDIEEKCKAVYSASWKDGPLEYDSNNKMLVRVQAREVTLKLCNSQNMINDFLNKVKVYVKIFNVYGITQYPDSKDYAMVLHQEECVKSYCETCIEEYTDMKHKWCEGGFAKVYSAEWKNGPLHYDKEWKRGSCKKVALKCLNKSQNKTEEFLNEIKAYSMNKYVLQYAKGGNFNGWINKCYKDFDWNNKLRTLHNIIFGLTTGRQPFSDRAHDKLLALDICNGIRPKLNELEAPKCYVGLMKRCWDSAPDNRPDAIEVVNIIYSYYISSNAEISKQFKEAEEYRKINISSIEINQSTTHPQASNISRLLNPFMKDLPKCDNDSECLDCSIAD